MNLQQLSEAIEALKEATAQTFGEMDRRLAALENEWKPKVDLSPGTTVNAKPAPVAVKPADGK